MELGFIDVYLEARSLQLLQYYAHMLVMFLKGIAVDQDII